MDIKLNGIRLSENKHREKNVQKDHYHKVHQILYVLENKGEVTFSGQTHPFKEDNLLFIPPYSKHAINSNCQMTVLSLEFSLNKLDSSIIELFNQQAYTETELLQINMWEANDIKRLLRRMLYEQTQGELINLVSMKICLAELLLILLRHQNQLNITDANVLRAERLKKYIDTRYFEVVDNETLSRELKVSTRYVNDIFKEHYHMTPMAYLNYVRISSAKSLLEETNKDIASICFEIGFEAISTFYRRFKSETGVSPNQYRLQHKEKYP